MTTAVDPLVVDDVVSGSGMPCTLVWADSGTPCCDYPAAWAERLACCGYVKVVCEAHHRLFQYMNEFVCRRCTTQHPGVEVSWRV